MCIFPQQVGPSSWGGLVSFLVGIAGTIRPPKACKSKRIDLRYACTVMDNSYPFFSGRELLQSVHLWQGGRGWGSVISFMQLLLGGDGVVVGMISRCGWLLLFFFQSSVVFYFSHTRGQRKLEELFKSNVVSNNGVNNVRVVYKLKMRSHSYKYVGPLIFYSLTCKVILDNVIKDLQHVPGKPVIAIVSQHKPSRRDRVEEGDKFTGWSNREVFKEGRNISDGENEGGIKWSEAAMSGSDQIHNGLEKAKTQPCYSCKSLWIIKPLTIMR